MSTTRRSILRGLAGLPLAPVYRTAAVAAPAALAAADPIPPIYAESLRLTGFINGGHHATEAEAEAVMDQLGACDTAALTVKATTPAGAIASIEWAKSELLEFGFRAHSTVDERDAGLVVDRGSRLVLALLDGALGVLRAQGGAA